MNNLKVLDDFQKKEKQNQSCEIKVTLSNIAECGVKAGTTGMKHSEESKRKISEGLKRSYIT